MSSLLNPLSLKEHQMLSLLENFETRLEVVKKNGQVVMENGEPKKQEVPKYKKGKKFPVIKMDMFWMSKEEKGGFGVALGPMDYVRITNPDGTPTKYFHLFSDMETAPSPEETVE